jgi:hypothetical protein
MLHYTHTPFSSFNPQQLNFYSFRKIKYADTIRIDPELEKETANYWRFRHENFQRGKPQLLTEIKRMNGQKSTTTTNTNSNSSVASNASAKAAVKEDDNTKCEVQVLKKRIEEMTKNIDKLTNMVEKVSLKQEAPSPYGNHESSEEEAAHMLGAIGNKRKKVAPQDDIRPDDMLSGMDLEDEMDIPAPEMPSPMPLSPESSDATQLTQISDNEFVDQLFTAFKEDEVEEVFKLDTPLEAPLLPLPPVVAKETLFNNNGPDPELMKRLGDALLLLPRETQEMIVDRLIAAITSTDSLEKIENVSPAALLKEAPVEPTKVVSMKLPPPPSAVPQSPPDQQEAQLPLAAATLAALLHHYSAQLKGKSPHNMEKTIPVIPVHG